MAMTRAQIATVIAGLGIGDTVEVIWQDGANTSTETGIVWQPPDSDYLGLGPDILDPNDTQLVNIAVKQKNPITYPQPSLGSVAVFVRPGGKVIYSFKRHKKGWYATGDVTPVPWVLLIGVYGAPDRVFSPGTPPAAPVLNTLTPGDEFLTVGATLGASGSTPIYDVQYRIVFDEFSLSPQEDTGWVSSGQDTGTFVIPRLANGVPYSVRVRALNSSGAGPQSNLLTATPIGLPGIPGTPTATPGNGQAVVTWTTPSDDGGSAIIGYKVEKISAADNTGWVVVTSSTGTATTNYTVTGLTNGTAYGFRVYAINAVGTGQPSNSSVGVTPTAPA